MQTSSKGFSIIEIIIAIVVISLLGAISWLYFSKTQPAVQTADTKQTQSPSPKEDPCKDGSSTAKNGTFCAKDVGISVRIPDIFKDKFQKIDNYDVMTQNSFTDNGVVFGKSEIAYQATVKHPHEDLSLIISKEPLRNFRVKSLAPALFNKDTKEVRYQDSNKEADSVVLDGHTFYTYSVGDAGSLSQTYITVIDDKLLVLSLVSQQQLGPYTYVVDSTELVKQFKELVKTLKLYK